MVPPFAPWLPLLVACAPWGLWGCWVLGGWLAMARLGDLPRLPERPGLGEPPAVTLCVPARNEARDLAKALASWLAQDWPALRIVVVDDGSTDATPHILASFAAAHGDRLKVVRNDALPPGWLGKNHALDLASRQLEARSAQWLLFADADVQAHPGLLGQAFGFLERQPGDLLTLLPALDTVGLAERVFLPWATLGFLCAVRFRQVPVAGAAAHCGVGAFLLVRRELYDAVGGHAAAPLEPIDDMALARRLKAAGGANRVALGGPGLHLRMYHGLGDLVRGMRKNALGAPILAPLAPVLLAALLGLGLAPLWLVLAGRPGLGAALWAWVPVLMGRAHRRFTGRGPDWAWALWPVDALLLGWGILWALADRCRGVNHWRGREVPLQP